MNMDELLGSLFASGFLTEESKAEITKQFQEAIDAYKTEVKAELAGQVVAANEKLAETVDAKLTTMLAAELSELKEDIAKFRDLEAEYALKLVEAKQQLVAENEEHRMMLVKKLDTFVSKALTEEFDELREDIAEMKKISFGIEVFESYADVFRKKFYDTSAEKVKLEMAESRVKELEGKVKVFESKAQSSKRAAEFARVLSPLSGAKREQMSLLLANTPTDKLEESYTKYIGHVLKSEADAPKKTVVESAAPAAAKTTVVTGNKSEVAGTAVKESITADPEIAALLRVAGISK